MESGNTPAEGLIDGIRGNGAASPCDRTASALTPLHDDETHQELRMRRLRHENHLLRLHLANLREQEHKLLMSADRRSTHPIPGGDAVQSGVPEVVPHGCPVTPDQSKPPPTSCNAADEEATALRTLFLRRREERQQHAAGVRSLLRSSDECHREPSRQQHAPEGFRQDSNDTATPIAPDLQLAEAPSMKSTDKATAKLDIVNQMYDDTDQRKALPTGSSPVTASPMSPDAALPLDTGTFDSLTAEAILQRYQDRKSQRRLRLEKMLGPKYSAASGGISDPSVETDDPLMPSLGAVPHGTAARQIGASSACFLKGNVATGGVGLEESNTHSRGPSSSWRHSRDGEDVDASTGRTTSPPVWPTRNPNQIGRAISDSAKNNSWYLCKVLEAALLDTIQARPASETLASALSTSPVGRLLVDSPLRGTSFGDGTSSAFPSSDRACLSHASGSNERSTGNALSAATLAARTGPVTSPVESASVSPNSKEAPQLLYHKGVNDKALKRAIEESLFLPFRCIQDAPRRLTSSQAADEGLPAFEAENRDAELCRCFGGGLGRKAMVGSNAHRQDDVGGVATGNDNEAHPEKEADMLNAKDESLDPFARLLLARLSAELPAHATKTEKKGGGKSVRLHDSSNDGFMHTTTSFPGASCVTSPRSSKAGISFVAAAGGDRRTHAPKKHFSRLDEVQVEMHAPVIFNQIRGFLRMDVERFRRAFAPTTSLSSSRFSSPPPVSGSGERMIGQLDRALQTQQRRFCVGAAAGSDETTVWRISVSPGKSGTTLLYFSDFVMKTVRPSEMEFLLRKFLPTYVRYCERNPHTLLPRFYALATLRWWKAGVVQHFVLMQNVFPTPYYIHRIYDVKGSTVNRTALQPGKSPPRTAFGAFLLKDNDLPSKLIMCGTYQRAILLAQFRSDVGFLRQLNIVDYSCMIGVRSRLFSREEGPSRTLLLLRHHNDLGHADPFVGRLDEVGNIPAQEDSGRTRSELIYKVSELPMVDGQCPAVGVTDHISSSFSTNEKQQSHDNDVYVCIHGCDGGLLSLPIYTPGDTTTAREDVYYLGIIDVLQTYNSAKRLESFAKGLINDRNAISVIAPDKYALRLYNVLERITV